MSTTTEANPTPAVQEIGDTSQKFPEQPLFPPTGASGPVSGENPTIIPAQIPTTLPEGTADHQEQSLSPEAAVRLQQLRNTLARRSVDHLGYPYNFDHAQHLGPLQDLLRFSINNLGDPFDPSNYEVQSRDFEREVIDTYATLWGAEANSYWGCVAHSGTEGNRLCLDIASRAFGQATMYCSASTHYSVPGAATSFKLELECIPTQVNGEIDYFLLAAALAKRKIAAGSKKLCPAIIVLNIGTTMSGAFDDVGTVIHILEHLGYDLNKEVFIHLDGALSGLMVPFMNFKEAHPVSCPTDSSKAFEQEGSKAAPETAHMHCALHALPSVAPKRGRPDFTAHAAVASYSCSGHKFLGCPMPAGVVVVRGNWVKQVHETVEYLGDTQLVTSMGSRNGHAPIFLWHELQRKGINGLRADVERCLKGAQTFFQLLQKNNIRSSLNPMSNTVVFERPKEQAFIKKYHLACQGDTAHVVVMPSVQQKKLEEFVEEFLKAKA